MFAEVLGEELDGEGFRDVAPSDPAQGSGDGRTDEIKTDEFAALEFVVYGGFGQDGDGVFDEDGAFEGFNGVELEMRGKCDAGGSEVSVDDFSSGQICGEGDEFMDADEAGGDFGFGGEGVIGGADEDELVVSEGLDFDAGASCWECNEA
jgi:hypothetical protein